MVNIGWRIFADNKYANMSGDADINIGASQQMVKTATFYWPIF